MKTEILKNIIRNFKQEDFFKIVNMHIHSTESDGKLTPLEIIKISQERGIKLISICDHNTVNAYRKTNILANDNIISGIEFDCWFKGILIHILGYNIDINNNEIKKLCAKINMEQRKT